MARVRITYKAVPDDASPDPIDLPLTEHIIQHEYNLFTAVGEVVTELLGDYSVVSITVNKLEG